MTIPKDLRAKAEAAREVSTTGWEVIERMYGLEIVDANNNEISVCYEAEVSSYIAAASPDVVISLLDEIERLQDKVDGLSSDLDSAVEVAFKRGATEWTKLNYPDHYASLTTGDTP